MFLGGLWVGVLDPFRVCDRDLGGRSCGVVVLDEGLDRLGWAAGTDGLEPAATWPIRFCFSRLISISEAFLARAPMRLRAVLSDVSSLDVCLTVSVRFFSEEGVSVMESFRRA